MDFLNDLFRNKKKKDIAFDLSIFEGFPLKITYKPYYRKIAIAMPINGVITVTTGKSTPQTEIMAFLNSNRDWILKAQEEIAAVKTQFPKVEFNNFDTLFWRGQTLKLYYLNKDKKNNFLPSTEYLSCSGPKPQSESHRQQVIKDLKTFYKTEAIIEIGDLLQVWSQKMELYPSRVSYRLQKSKWGSCGSNGHISMNWGLITCPKKITEYVVIHELAHLKHQNHSKNFWSLVERYCPDYKERKTWLKNNNYICDFLQNKSQLHP